MQIIAFLSVIVLARILTPAEIGIFSIANAIIVIAYEIRSFGVGQYVVQEKELSLDKMRAAAGVMFLASWAVAAMLIAGSPLLASFYGEPGVQAIVLVLSVNFIVIPFGGIISSVLQREMAFGKIYNVRLLASLVYAVSAVSLALIGLSYMSMAWAGLLGVVVSVLGFLYYRPVEVPVMPGLREFRRVFAFGSFASGASLLRRVAEAVPELIIGRLLTMATVGYFSRAYGLLLLFSRAVLWGIRPVMLPHLSAQLRNDGDAAGSYLKSISWVTALAWPFYGFLVLTGYPVIRILYGDQWDAAFPIVQALGLWACLEVLYCFSAELLVAVGAVKRLFWREVISLPVRILLIYWLVGYGVLFVGAALAVVGVLEFLLTSHFIRLATGISIRRVLEASLGSALITLTALAAPLAVALSMEIGPDRYLLPVVLAGAGGLLGWLLGIRWTRHEIGGELDRGWRRLRGYVAEVRG